MSVQVYCDAFIAEILPPPLQLSKRHLFCERLTDLIVSIKALSMAVYPNNSRKRLSPLFSAFISALPVCYCEKLEIQYC